MRFSRPENLKNNMFATLGQGRAERRAGPKAGCRAQGQGTKGKAGLQDSILRFSRPENPKITVLQLFEEKGEGG